MKNPVYILFFTFYIGAVYPAIAQSIRINEILSSNSILKDEDGDTPDGIELYNLGDVDISLEGLSLSDDLSKPDKWKFTNHILPSKSYLWIWASGKDRTEPFTARTLINAGDDFKYVVPDRSLNNWFLPTYNDISWRTGASGFGYGDEDDRTVLPSGTSTVYIRKTFSIGNLNSIDKLLFHIDYDDGFVAYINGVEIARANMEGVFPAYNAFATNNHEAIIYQGQKPEEYNIDDISNLLINGDNYLCIAAHNVSSSSSDFTLIPYLSIVSTQPESGGITPPDILELRDGDIHTNFKVSAGGETLYLFDKNQQLLDSLYVPEIPVNKSFGYASDSVKSILSEVTPGAVNPKQQVLGQVQSEVTFSHQGGITGPVSLQLSGNAQDEKIRYTLDATEPTVNSQTYTQPIPVTKTQVVRAQIFNDGYLPSAVQSRTFLMNEASELPIVSLVTAPGNFFDPDTGMYVLETGYQGDNPYFGSNIWEDWERPIHFSIYETNGDLGIAFNGGVKIFGGWSRANNQRSLSIFARKAYGPASIYYPLFPQLSFDRYESIVLRNSGNDWMNTMFRDAMITSLMKGSGLDYAEYRPATTFINGDYWGFYNMREKINEHFLASNHNVDEEKIDLLELDAELVHGDNTEYLALLDFITQNDLAIDANYLEVENQMDIKNFIRYQVLQIFANNTDWPGNNIKYWKAEGGKWRWIVYDTDFGFGIWNVSDYSNNTLKFALENNGSDWPNPSWSTFLMRKLLENNTFKQNFINYFSDALNTRFQPESVNAHIEEMADYIEPEIVRHYARWGQSTSEFYNKVRDMQTFATNRPTYVRNHLRAEFALTSEINVVIDNATPHEGCVQLNSLIIKEHWWEGFYYEQVPIKVKAVASPGYHFSHWEGSINSNALSMELTLEKPIRLKPVFAANKIESMPLVINEINYNSGQENPSGDWVELYNPNNFEINVSNWVLTDKNEKHKYHITSGTLIEAKGYLIVAESPRNFTATYPKVQPVMGEYYFGFSNNWDEVKLYDSSNTLIDSVAYSSQFPWPEKADGEGFTLELLHPELDNNLAKNWVSVHEFGSPGTSNFEDTKAPFVEVSSKITLYPNPSKTNSFIFIHGIDTPKNVKIVSLEGKETSLNIASGNKIKIPNLPNGVYILLVTHQNGYQSRTKLLIQ